MECYPEWFFFYWNVVDNLQPLTSNSSSEISQKKQVKFTDDFKYSPNTTMSILVDDQMDDGMFGSMPGTCLSLSYTIFNVNVFHSMSVDSMLRDEAQKLIRIL